MFRKHFEWIAADPVDSYHPNDLGFYMMYTRVLPVLMDALQAAGELQ